jgi:CopA family copper-resistance protein
VTDTNQSWWERPIERRDFVRAAGAVGLLAGAEALLPRYAWGLHGASTGLEPLTPRRIAGVAEFDLVTAETPLAIGARTGHAVTMNGTIPAPLLRFREGEEVVIRASNRLREDTSIHWHGLLVPPEMDGVPGVSFPGIKPGETFVYRFPIKQYGTYWYHSHSGFQEQLGHYGPIVIDPKDGYPFKFDREYVIVLSDWTFENPHKVLDRLKKQGNYYNIQRRTVGDFFRDVGRNGLMPTVRERLMWLQMRMDPTDILDVTGMTYTYLMNGLAPGSNWTGLFQPGERVLLRFINAGADTMFDVRIPGLPMTVVQVSGQFVEPVETDEFRIANAETYDVVIEPRDQPYTIFAESMDRTGYARGTLTPRAGWNAPIPERRKRELLTMADMGMSHGDMPGMNMGGGGMDHSNMPGMGTAPATKAAPPAASADPHAGHGAATPARPPSAGAAASGAMAGMAMPAPAPATESARYAIAGMTRTTGLRAPGTIPGMIEHEPGRHGVDNAAVPMMVMSRVGEPGIGLGNDGWRVLRYTDLRSLKPHTPFRAPTREIEMHLTGNMERFMWSIDGVPFDRSQPIRMNFGERVRLTMVNDTMMNHPMHLHGMWMELENGHGDRIPRVHTLNVKPAERVSFLIEVDAPGRWAFHCHILYHMEVGMFRVFEVSEPGKPFALEGDE